MFTHESTINKRIQEHHTSLDTVMQGLQNCKVKYVLFTAHCTLYVVFSSYCTVYSVHYTVYSIQCTLYSVQYTVYSIQCTVYSVHCTPYFSLRGSLTMLLSVCRPLLLPGPPASYYLPASFLTAASTYNKLSQLTAGESCQTAAAEVGGHLT